jgi:hypothetical protein
MRMHITLLLKTSIKSQGIGRLYQSQSGWGTKWRSVKSYDIDSKDSMERWKNNLYEVSTRRCAQITKVVHWIGSELCDAPRFDGIGPMDTFLAQMEKWSQRIEGYMPWI